MKRRTKLIRTQDAVDIQKRRAIAGQMAAAEFDTSLLPPMLSIAGR